LVKQILRPIKYRLKEGRFLKNINKRSAGNPRVLISYTVIPFLSNKKSHTNRQESRVIAELFDLLGYQVDVIHYTNPKKPNYQDYDVIFGFGEPFENSFRDLRCNAKWIYYATGAHVFHQNPAEARRVTEFNRKYGVNLLPQRLVPWCWTLSTTFSDFLIVIGNDWTASTYTNFTDKPVLPINATALINKYSVNIQRDLTNARKNFLWFGSAGLVHKGLDLCLEYFSAHPEYTLHICGPQEPEFFRVMQNFLKKTNIVYHGFVDVSSEKFIDITSLCLFTILPSCSEGQATALLTAMGAGLIPIATCYTGVNIDQLGYLIDRLEVDAIDDAIKIAQAQSDEQLINQSTASMDYIQNNHTLDKFKNNLAEQLAKCLHGA
jgi:hypothetical protein